MVETNAENITPKFDIPLPTTDPVSTPITQNHTPTQGAVDNDSLVSNQLTGLLADGSKYTNLAKQGAMETANSRGLLNSSIAAGAGERAAIESALPIAQQDAATHNTQRLTNQNITNDFEKSTQTADLNTQMADNELSRARNLSGYNTELGEYTAQANRIRQEELLTVENQLKEQLAGLQQDFNIQLETLKSNYDIQGNLDSTMGALYSDTIKSLAAFLSSPNLTTEQQEAGAASIVGNLQAGLDFLNGITNTPGTF